MNAKKAKWIRIALRNEKFPALTNKVTNKEKMLNLRGLNPYQLNKERLAVFKNNPFAIIPFPELTNEVPINHVRRIRRLITNRGMSLERAVIHHKHLHKIPHVFQKD